MCMLSAEQLQKTKLKYYKLFLFELEDLGLLPAFSFKNMHRKVYGHNCEGTLDTFVHNYAC